ncbi:hypothetical protein PG985_016297 [Apiospora marii]|uniref:uncharacterized protein n=1 Tax=Apiospora marii TaxID=335849 RepID=UPI0031316B45
MAQVDSPYRLMESYAKLQGSFPILESFSLPEEVREPISSIKAWCDEWEDLSIPASPVVRYLKGRGSAPHHTLKDALDRVFEAFASEAVTSLSQPRQEQTDALTGRFREARERIQQAVRNLNNQSGTDPDRLVGQTEHPELRRSSNAQDVEKIKRARDKIGAAWKGLMLSGREVLSGGVPPVFGEWDFWRELARIAGPRAGVVMEAMFIAYGPRVLSYGYPGRRRRIFLHNVSS